MKARIWDQRACAHITSRESDILVRLVDGGTILEIADDLGIRVTTARMHVRHLHVSVGSRTLHGLAVWAIRHRECCLRGDPHPTFDQELIESAIQQRQD